MRFRRILPALIAAAFAAPLPAGANTYTVVFNSAINWTSAKNAAILAGGYLATITSPAEQAAVEAAIAAASPVQSGGFWINLRETTECCYIWDNGEASCYANFYASEPNNGAPGETHGQIIWNLTDASRRGPWNDVPVGGLPGSSDISRLGYVIEFGPADPAGGPCGACIRVNPNSFCNTPPGGATVKTTLVTGVSIEPPPGPGDEILAVRTIERTIIDVEPNGPNGARLMQPQATYTVSVPVPTLGVPAHVVVAAFIDSINRTAGPGGFVANYASLSSNIILRMYRVGGYGATDVNTVPGITVSDYPPPSPPVQGGGGVQGPMLAWPAQALAGLALTGLAARAMRRRKPPDS